MSLEDILPAGSKISFQMRVVHLDPGVIQDLPEGWRDAGQWTKEQLDAWRAEGAAPLAIPKLPPL